jgi:putative hydrolase of the HAD superfamily
VAELEATQPDKVREMRAVAHAANKGIVSPEESTARIAELLDMSVEDYRDRIRTGEVRDTKLLDYIKTLRGTYKTALLSNITQQGIERRFPDNELNAYFDEVVISSEIGYTKPDPEAYIITAERLGVTLQECLFTDDRPDYIAAARQCGMQGIVYESFPQFKDALTEVL